MPNKQEIITQINENIYENKRGTITSEIVKDILTNITGEMVGSSELDGILDSQTQILENIRNEAIQAASVSKTEFDDKGPYNANTNSPTLSGSYNTVGVLKQPLYTVTVAGSAKFTGTNFASGSALSVGDEIRGLSGSYYRKPYSDLSLQRVNVIEQNFVRKNLANPAEFVDGKFINGLTGSEGVNAAYGYTGFIPVNVGSTYAGRGTTNIMRHLACYDFNMQFVPSGSATDILTFTVPANVSYVRASFYATDKTTFQFESGSVATAFTPYTAVQLNSTVAVQPTNVVNTSLFRFTTDAEKTLWNNKLNASSIATSYVYGSKNMFLSTNVVSGSNNVINTSTGQFQTIAGWIRTGAIQCEANTTYTISGLPTIDGKVVRFEDKDGIFISSTTSPVGTATFQSFTSPANAAIMYINLQRNTETANLNTIQIEKGSVVTGYVNYGGVSKRLVSVDGGDLEPLPQISSKTIYRGKNIFDPSNVISGSIVVTSTGQFSYSFPGWTRTGPVFIEPNSTYTISGLVSRSGKAIRFEGPSGSFLSYLGTPSPTTGTSWTFNSPASASVMYINLARDTETVTYGNVQIESGSVVTALEPFVPAVVKVTSINGVALSAGLDRVDNTPDLLKPVSLPQQTVFDAKLDKTSVVTQVVGASKNLANPALFTDGFYMENTGVPVSNVAYGYTSFIKVTSGSTYTGWDGTQGMRKTALYDSSFNVISGAGSSANVTTFTVTNPNAAYVRVTYYKDFKNTFQFESGSSASTYVAYAAGVNTLISVSGAVIANTTANQVEKTITLADREQIMLVGDSYSVGYNALPGKNYISILSMFSDWNFDNYSKSGDSTSEILARLVANTAQYKNVSLKQLKGGGYAIVISFTNDVNDGVIDSSAYLNTYLNNIKLIAEAVKGLGYKPIIATEYHNSTGINGTGLLQTAMSQLCEEYGYPFMDVFEKTRYLRGTSYSYYWEGSHPGIRANAIFWTNMLPYVNSLPRPKWGIKIFRKRDTVVASTVNDLNYTTIFERAKLFKEILVTGQAMTSGTYNMYDDQGNWTPTNNTVSVSEYYDLLNGNTIAMPDYSLVEVIINSTGYNTSKLNIKIGAVDTVYVKNHITQAWTSLPITDGTVTLTDLMAQINFDKVSLVVYKAGGWSMSAPQVTFTGVEGKHYYTKPQPREFRSAELVTTRNFNSGTTGWTVSGSITPTVPEDSVSLPTGITQIATITASNYVTQTVTFTSATYKRKAQLKVIARRNPARYSSANTFPTNSPITLDSYDFANVKVVLLKGASNIVNFKKVVGLHWTEVVFEFDIIAGDSSLIISIQRDDQDFELADLSMKIE